MGNSSENVKQPRDLKEFLRHFGTDVLREKRVLYTGRNGTNILQGKSIKQIWNLMEDKRIDSLLVYDEYFINKENASKKEYWSAILRNQNASINPHFLCKLSGDEADKDKAGKDKGLVDVISRLISNAGEVTRESDESGESDTTSTSEKSNTTDTREELDTEKRCRFWYRGVLGYTEKLIPSLYHGVKEDINENNGKSSDDNHISPQDEYERDQIELFKTKSCISEKKERMNEWDILCTMQHYGFYTRLLDWTEDPLMALAFAVRADLSEEDFLGKLALALPADSDEKYSLKAKLLASRVDLDKKGFRKWLKEHIEKRISKGDEKNKPDPVAVIWMLDPVELNKSAFEHLKSEEDRYFYKYLNTGKIVPHIYSIEKHLPKKYKIADYRNMGIYSKKLVCEVAHPIACYFTQNNDRIAGQRGAFTIFPRKSKINEDSGLWGDPEKDYIKKIEITLEQAMECRIGLNLLGYNAYKMYPELSKLR